jgi:hypothetical protein
LVQTFIRFYRLEAPTFGRVIRGKKAFRYFTVIHYPLGFALLFDGFVLKILFI